LLVIPPKAGIHFDFVVALTLNTKADSNVKMDPRFRWNDGLKDCVPPLQASAFACRRPPHQNGFQFSLE